MIRDDQEVEKLSSQTLSSMDPGQSTAAQAYMNFLKSILGIAVIALPFATSLVGWVWSIVLLIPICYCSIKSNSLLIEVADDLHTERMLYADVLRVTLGGCWPFFIDIVIILLQVGVCIAYLIFIVETTLNQFARVNIELTKLSAYVMTLVLIAPLSFIKKIHFFHQTSKYGYYLALISICIMLVDAFYEMNTKEVHYDNFIHVRPSFAYVGVAIAVCEGIVTLLPIRDSMNNKLEFMGVAISAIMTAFGISLLVSISAVFAYTDIKPIVLFNISNTYAQIVAVVLYAISLLLTYPLQLFPGVQVIEEMIDIYQSKRQMDYEERKRKKDNELITSDPLEIFIRITIMILIYLIAYQVPHFSHFLNLIGSLFGSMIQFLFPVLAHMYHFKNKQDFKQPIILYIIVLSVAVLSIVLGTLESIGSMI